MDIIEKIKLQDSEIQESIYHAPVFMTLFAANLDGVLNDHEIVAAVDFLKAESYNGPDMLKSYFQYIHPDFKNKVLEWNNELPFGKPNRDRKLIELMAPVRKFIESLEEGEAKVFKRELTEFTMRIESSNKSLLESAILPLFSGFLHKKTSRTENDQIL